MNGSLGWFRRRGPFPSTLLTGGSANNQPSWAPGFKLRKERREFGEGFLTVRSAPEALFSSPPLCLPRPRPNPSYAGAARLCTPQLRVPFSAIARPALHPPPLLPRPHPPHSPSPGLLFRTVPPSERLSPSLLRLPSPSASSRPPSPVCSRSTKQQGPGEKAGIR